LRFRVCTLYEQKFTFILVHRGRSVNHPEGPTRIPACGFIEPGSSEVLASAQASSKTRNEHPSYSLRAAYAAGFHDTEPGQEVIESKPIIALALATQVYGLPPKPDNAVMKQCQTWQVTVNTEEI
jgi:hypothetical protein